MRPLVLLLAALALPLAAACGRGEAADEPVWRGEGAAIEVTVFELHCPGCEKAVEDEIATVEGVEEVVADHLTGRVCVRLADPALRARTIPALREAIHAAGKQVVGEDEIGEGE